MKAETPYNPLDKIRLGESVANAILKRPVEPLPPSEVFPGAGIYVIYYMGNFPAYCDIAEKNKDNRFQQPIYVGKAIPSGGRKGGIGSEIPKGKPLYNRLKEHADSISEVKNLELKDFCCRYLVVDDIWIPLGESLLISGFSPVWNIVIDGFGNHDPGGGRYQQQRSPWDMIHPGRAWAMKCQANKKSEDEILKMLQAAVK